MARKDNYQLLIEKLDQFIRKYYINQLLRGLLYTIGLVLLLFLVVSTLEYFYYFNQTGRKVLLYSFLGVSLVALSGWVLLPLLRYFRLGKVISHSQAADIIGDHFHNVKDKLLNILQLKEQSASQANKDLILASIDQKSEEIRPVPFQSAINLSSNRKYLRYALPPLLVLLIILFAAPSVIRDSTRRLINNNVDFERPAPFQFVLADDNPSVVQFEDYPLSVKIKGEQLPNDVFIEVDGAQYRLSEEDPTTFTYRFSNVQKDLKFRLFSAGVSSRRYTLDVLQKPNIVGFDVQLDYPAYTGRRDEELSSIGDLIVPEGTTIDWVFNAENTDDIQLLFQREGEKQPAKRFSDELFTFKRRVTQDDTYKLYVSNEALPNADSILYSLSIIPDYYPEVSVESVADSTDEKLVYFVGEASDDYGLRSLSFNYRINGEDGSQGPLETELLREPTTNQIQYDHLFDLNTLNLKPGDQVSYYFEVYDNDGVNGSKSARTNMMVFATPTLEELEAQSESNDETIKENLKKAIDENKKLQEEMKKMREKLLQQKEMDWQSRQEMERLLERQKELQKQIEEARKAFEENRKTEEELEQSDPETRQKQEKLEEMFDKAMNEEMQRLMEQIQEMLQKLEKDQALEMMEQMENNSEQKQMEMERLEELFKQLELEQEVNKAVDKLEKLAEEQDKLSEEMDPSLQEEEQEATDEEQQEGEQQSAEEENKEGEQQEGEQENQEGENQENKEGEQQEGENQEQENQEGEQQENQEGEQQNQEQQQQQSGDQQEELQKKQEEIQKEFEKLMEQMEQIQEKNQEMESPQSMPDNQEQMEDIQRSMQEIQQQLQQQQNQQAGQKSKQTSKQMKEMAQQMQQNMQAGQMEQMQEDMEALRQLLENLVGLSFDQEELIDKFENTAINTPKYVDLVQEQFKLEDDFGMIEDSLQALSKRVFQIETFVTDKVGAIRNNMKTTLEDLEERRKFQAADHQQRVMKNTNDLALMLSETMNQMQQQMSAMMSGQQSSKPSSGQPKDQISQGQQQLNQEAQQRLQQMKESGKRLSAEEYAKLAARQAALRQALEEKAQKMREQGKGNPQLQEMIDAMDKVETELVNKELTNEMMERQQEILNRLLDYEKAEREQEFDQKRKAEQASMQEREMPPALQEYIKQRQAEIDQFKTVSPNLKPYYKGLVEEYFKSLKSGNN
jgi:hypothetical protein